MTRSTGPSSRHGARPKRALLVSAGLLCTFAAGAAIASATPGTGPTLLPADAHATKAAGQVATNATPPATTPTPAAAPAKDAPAVAAPPAPAPAPRPAVVHNPYKSAMGGHYSSSATHAAPAAPPPPPRPSGTAPYYGAGGGTYQVEVAASKSQVLEVPAAYTDLMIADPKIADVIPLTAHSVYVVGKTAGSTALTIYGPGKRLIAAVNVIVGPDIDGLKLRLHEIMPDERDISIHAANQSILLSGTVSNGVSLEQIASLADSYDPGKVVNMLGVQGTQQVMLTVRFVEMDKSAGNQFGVQINTVNGGKNPSFDNSFGSALAGAFGTAALTTFWSYGDITVAVDGLETRGLVKTLAEPTLVVMSGDTGSFLAGGEIPIPIAQTAGFNSTTITVEYKTFGISLAFTPTILKDGMINLVVKPEVSSLAPEYSVTESGLVIPGLKVRRASSTLELRDGESFTMAGLMADNYSNNINAFPWLGNIPILGALFKSTDYQKSQSELVIVVTPHLVTAHRGPLAMPSDHFTPPSDYELFLFGMLSGKAGAMNPEDRALMSQDPTKGGVEGPYGHVLY